ncbi:exopolysaccharide biosynthesis polyprenyl glycosylphosphotransferase [Butyrivibrio sp.]|uniref:exopolysaccharide biosynthesis polyprenyl glycosylphosphotransferase n=1 Tax=Butyrivibrio sp. TaxID=28121 RepID=UPI0025C1A2CD|nr:exopolysaccharide biosynthesis polyprenyl glycosylphosphotransferase [Butyrivibrio sp.]
MGNANIIKEITESKNDMNNVSVINKGILFLLKGLWIAICTGIFFTIWLEFYKVQLYEPFYERGNYAVSMIYAVIFWRLSKLYGCFDIDLKKPSEIIYSTVISLTTSSFIIYVVAWLLVRKLPSVVPLLIHIAVCSLLSVIWARTAVLTCDRLNKPKKVLLIYDNEQAKENGLSIINKLTRKFVLHGVKHVNEDVSKTILHITTTMPDALMLCGLHSTPRNAILKFCATNSIPVYIRPNIGDYLLDDAREIQMANLPVKVYEKSDRDYFYLFLKRLFDIVLSMTGLIVASPIMLITAIAIKLYDGGPIFYSQVRLTKDRKEFTIYKFRSMKIDAEADGRARLASVADDRITPVGKLIRATRIDELPQIICILKGDMSIVGPRPERPELCRVYEEEMPEFALRTEVKAGLTGYAQVYGKYNTEPYDKLQMDLMYISNQNLYTDFKIILATIKIMFLPESSEGVKN